MTHPSYLLPALLCALACNPAPDELRQVGDYSAARIDVRSNVELATAKVVGAGRVGVTCEEPMADQIITAREGQELVVTYEGADLEAIAGCTIYLHGDAMSDLSFGISDGTPRSLFVNGLADLDLIEASEVRLHLRGSEQLHVGQIRGLLLEIDAQGGALQVDVVDVETLDISASGHPTIAVDALHGTTFLAELSGKATVHIGGEVNVASVATYGGAFLDGPGLIVQHATIETVGNSEVQLFVEQDADVDARGTSRVVVGGDGAVTVNTTGAAVVTGL